MSNWGLSVASGVSPAVGPVSVARQPASYGSWVELVASVPSGVVGVTVFAFGVGNQAQSLFRLGVGAAGSEVSVADDLQILFRDGDSVSCFLPISLPAGQRLSISAQGNSGITAGSTVDFGVSFAFQSGRMPVGGSRIVAFGWGGTYGTHSLSAQAPTGGAWSARAQAVSSTSARARFASVVRGGDNAVGSYGLAGLFYGTGLTLAVPEFATDTFNNRPQTPRFLPCDIAAGSDLRVGYRSIFSWETVDPLSPPIINLTLYLVY